MRILSVGIVRARDDSCNNAVVRRRDLRLASDPQARALAISDNRVGELDLDWDPAILQQLQADGLDLGLFWTTEEFERLLGEGRAGYLPRPPAQ